MYLYAILNIKHQTKKYQKGIKEFIFKKNK